MLEHPIRKYHNKIITVAEVIEELIDLSRDIVAMDITRELTQQDKLKKLVVVLTEMD